MPHPDLETAIIYEDQDLLVLNKPPGVVVNDSQTTVHQTVQTWFKQRSAEAAFPPDSLSLVPESFNSEFGTPESIFEERSGMVHRLDKDTSGVLVLAKHPGSLVHLLVQFKTRQVSKRYLCLAHGKFRLEADTITAPLGRASQDRKVFAVRAEGRQAVTEYQVQRYFPHFLFEKFVEAIGKEAYRRKKTELGLTGKVRSKIAVYQGFSLVECRPQTGRTHQIRVHLAHLKHPLVGDSAYVGKKRAKLDALWCPRQFLHAGELEFMHPRTGERVSFEASLSPDLERVLGWVG